MFGFCRISSPVEGEASSHTVVNKTKWFNCTTLRVIEATQYSGPHWLWNVAVMLLKRNF